eukprot:gb/GECG01003252.1/.p1 GENE.gb/GECG01003252.1/~~gb/GECG01003252.1/.p1  ORF type:complete len:1287 (+),score=277.68 gb/GECG01003252.1/:1-3861(+)
MSERYNLAARDILQRTLEIHQKRKKEEESKYPKGTRQVVTLNRSSSSFESFQFSPLTRISFDEEDKRLLNSRAEAKDQKDDTASGRSRLYRTTNTYTSSHSAIQSPQHHNKGNGEDQDAGMIFQKALAGAYSVLSKKSENEFQNRGAAERSSSYDALQPGRRSSAESSERVFGDSGMKKAHEEAHEEGETPPEEVGPVLDTVCSPGYKREKLHKHDPLHVPRLSYEEGVPSLIRELKNESENSSINSLKDISSKNPENAFGRHRFGDFDNSEALVNAMAATLEKKVKLSTHESVSTIEELMRQISDIIYAIRSAAEKAARIERGELPSVAGALPWAALNATVVDDTFFENEKGMVHSNKGRRTKEKFSSHAGTNEYPPLTDDNSGDDNPHSTPDTGRESKASTAGDSSRFLEYRYDITQTSKFDALKELEDRFTRLVKNMREFIDVTCSSASETHNDNLFKMMEIDTKHINWLKQEHERILAQVRSGVRSQVQATLRAQRCDGSGKEDQSYGDDAAYMAALRQRLEAEASQAKLDAESREFRRRTLAHYTQRLRKTLAKVSKGLGISVGMIPVPPALTQEDIEEINPDADEEEGQLTPIESPTDEEDHDEQQESDEEEVENQFNNELFKKMEELEDSKRQVQQYEIQYLEEKERREELENENSRLQQLLEKASGNSSDKAGNVAKRDSDIVAAETEDYFHDASEPEVWKKDGVIAEAEEEPFHGSTTEFEEGEVNVQTDVTEGNAGSEGASDKEQEGGGKEWREPSDRDDDETTKARKPQKEKAFEKTRSTKPKSLTKSFSSPALRNKATHDRKPRSGEKGAQYQTSTERDPHASGQGESTTSPPSRKLLDKSETPASEECTPFSQNEFAANKYPDVAEEEEKEQEEQEESDTGFYNGGRISRNATESDTRPESAASKNNKEIDDEYRGVLPVAEKEIDDKYREELLVAEKEMDDDYRQPLPIAEKASERRKKPPPEQLNVEDGDIPPPADTGCYTEERFASAFPSRDSSYTAAFRDVSKKEPTHSSNAQASTEGSPSAQELHSYLEKMEEAAYLGARDTLMQMIHSCKHIVSGYGMGGVPSRTREDEPKKKVVTEHERSAIYSSSVAVVNIDLGEESRSERRNSISTPEWYWRGAVRARTRESNLRKKFPSRHSRSPEGRRQQVEAPENTYQRTPSIKTLEFPAASTLEGKLKKEPESMPASPTVYSNTPAELGREADSPPRRSRSPSRLQPSAFSKPHGKENSLQKQRNEVNADDLRPIRLPVRQATKLSKPSALLNEGSVSSW